MGGLDIAQLCDARRWSRTRLISEMRKMSARDDVVLPGDDSLKRMIRQWCNGTRRPGSEYEQLLRRVFGQVVDPEPSQELVTKLHGSSLVDLDVIASLEAQTQNFRVLDRRLGAQRLLGQTRAHARATADLADWTPSSGKLNQLLAAAGAEAAALAGWQALDLGKPSLAWQLHNLAKSLARESDNLAILAHVSAQQAYALIDVNETIKAVELVHHIRQTTFSKLPNIIRAWLLAVEAEANSAAGNTVDALALLDRADSELDHDNEEYPFITLNSAHMLRWRGNCLARLQRPEAIGILADALDRLDPHFARAAATLHVDIVIAHIMAGNRDVVAEHVQEARALVDSTGSNRQRIRLARLIETERQKV